MMGTVMLRERHRKRIFLLFGAVLAILWFYIFGLPGLGGGTGSGLFNSRVDVSGLTFSNRHFFLNKKPFRILSGAMHYFRVPQPYWKDRMLKMKACGLNTLETYVSWNLHEPQPGKFNFEGMLNLRKYIEEAQKAGLYVILRPGPYICSEWDFGGLPSWLLADPNMKVRSNYLGYQEAITRFFMDLLPRVADLQFSRGGPIIAVQVENEFGSYSNEVEHLLFIKRLLLHNGIEELLVTSDGIQGLLRAVFYGEALPTGNFKDIEGGRAIFQLIKQESADFPLMVMEFWTGWFDHWGQLHNTDALDEYKDRVSTILNAGASINFYMFHGGTNFGFMAGANQFDSYKPDVTSYDYDAPLSESGDITQKYLETRELLLQNVYKPLGIENLPDLPPDIPKTSYGKLRVEEYMNWKDLTSQIMHPKPMEMYKFGSQLGQSYGYIIYRKQCGSGKNLQLDGRMQDRAQVLVNTWSVVTFEMNTELLVTEMHIASQPSNELDIIVENLGRVNFVNFNALDRNILNKQRKGFSGKVKLDGQILMDWTVLALDFDDDFLYKVSRASSWQPFVLQKNLPTLYRAYLNIPGTPQDTFIRMTDWKKGIVIVNGINLGRYWDIGPQRTLYLPAPFLRTGKNEFLVFEEHVAGEYMFFEEHPQLG